METLVPKNILDAVFAKKKGFKKSQNKSDSANQSILSLLQGKNSNIQQHINLMQNTQYQSPAARLNKTQDSHQQSGAVDTAPPPKNMNIVEEKGTNQQPKKSSLRLIKTKPETVDTKTVESTASIPKDPKKAESQLLAKLAKSK